MSLEALSDLCLQPIQLGSRLCPTQSEMWHRFRETAAVRWAVGDGVDQSRGQPTECALGFRVEAQDTRCERRHRGELDGKRVVRCGDGGHCAEIGVGDGVLPRVQQSDVRRDTFGVDPTR